MTGLAPQASHAGTRANLMATPLRGEASRAIVAAHVDIRSHTHCGFCLWSTDIAVRECTPLQLHVGKETDFFVYRVIPPWKLSPSLVLAASNGNFPGWGGGTVPHKRNVAWTIPSPDSVSPTAQASWDCPSHQCLPDPDGLPDSPDPSPHGPTGASVKLLRLCLLTPLHTLAIVDKLRVCPHEGIS